MDYIGSVEAADVTRTGAMQHGISVPMLVSTFVKAYIGTWHLFYKTLIECFGKLQPFFWLRRINKMLL